MIILLLLLWFFEETRELSKGTLFLYCSPTNKNAMEEEVESWRRRRRFSRPVVEVLIPLLFFLNGLFGSDSNTKTIDFLCLHSQNCIDSMKWPVAH